MPSLPVEATPSAGVIGYTLLVDGNVVPMDYTTNQGAIPVSGACGDHSKHQLLYTFEGPADETLSVIITCAGAEVCNLKKAKITPNGVPYGGGKKDFYL